MAAYSNRLAMTQVPIHRSFKSPRKDIQELETKGESGYKVRNEDELSKVELLCLHALDDDPKAKKLFTLDFATLFKGPKTQLETWPLFFHSKEESGTELQQGLVTLWSNFLIVYSPRVAVKTYGYTWMISIMSDLWSIAITALFLGFLLGCPNKVAWKWTCEIGWLRSIPTILVLFETIITLATIAYTCWILYGYQIG